MAQTQPTLPGVTLMEWALDWLKARIGAHDQLGELSPEDLRELAADLAIDETELHRLATHATDNTPLMEGMIRARGLEPEQLQRSFAVLLRDVERMCSTCRATGRCRRELAAGTAGLHAHDYCPNAGTFDDIVAATAPKPA